MTIIEDLYRKIIVSSQAMPDEPFYDENSMIAMMKSVVNGGASALRVAGERDVKNAKRLFNIPVIGITKPDRLPKNWKEVVYITPTMDDVRKLAKAGADIIAFDGTKRKRPNCTLEDIINEVKSLGKLAMADISTLEEGLICAELGVDIISTTLSGYTLESEKGMETPDFELLKQLVIKTDKPIILEGRIWEKSEVEKAFQLNAHSVVIGSAITRPQLIVKRFMEGIV